MDRIEVDQAVQADAAQTQADERTDTTLTRPDGNVSGGLRYWKPEWARQLDGIH